MATFKHKTGQASTATWRTLLAVHPAAELFPLIGEYELRGLADDIAKHGLRDKVDVYYDRDGKPWLIDGRNRFDALAALGRDLFDDSGKLRTEFQSSPPPRLYTAADVVAYVIAKNILRRHLTVDDRARLIRALLKAQPEKSNRQIAKQVGASHPHVAKVRRQAEETGDVETVTTSIDTKGRKQPTRKPKTESPTEQWEREHPEDVRCPRCSPHAAAAWRRKRGIQPRKTEQKVFASPEEAHAPETETPIVPAEAEQEESDDDGYSLAGSLQITYNDVWEECQETKNWPDLSAARKAHLKRAMTKLRSAFSELIELATPVKRGRPPKVKEGAVT
jgi:DNA-binding Lrp family transcriptional regulator